MVCPNGQKKTLAKSNQIDRMALINEQNKKRFKHSSWFICEQSFNITNVGRQNRKKNKKLKKKQTKKFKMADQMINSNILSVNFKNLISWIFNPIFSAKISSFSKETKKKKTGTNIPSCQLITHNDDDDDDTLILNIFFSQCNKVVYYTTRKTMNN